MPRAQPHWPAPCTEAAGAADVLRVQRGAPSAPGPAQRVHEQRVSPRLSVRAASGHGRSVRVRWLRTGDAPERVESGEIQEPLWESSALISQNVLAEGTRLVEEVSEEYFGYLLE